MNLSQLETYKLVEAAGHISIVPAKATVPGAYALVTTDIRTMCVYLERYMWERAGGATMEQAHKVGLQGMRIVPRG
jgi:hypothetical protein